MTRNRQLRRVTAGLVVAAALVPGLWALGWIDVLRPAWLAGLLVLPVFPWLARRSLAGLPPPVSAASVAVRGGLTILLVLALADVRTVREHDRLAVMFALDHSASIPPEVRERQLLYVREALTTRSPDDLAGLVLFAADASVESTPRQEPVAGPLRSWVDPEFTDLENALRVGAAAFPPRVRRKIVLVTDGNENAGDLLAGVRNAVGQGIQVDVLPVAYQLDREVAIERISTPENVAVNETFPIRVTVTALQETEATLQLYRDGQPLLEEGRQLTLRAGPNTVTVNTRLTESGFHTYQARIAAAEDSIVANNQAVGFVHIEGRSRLLFAAPRPAAVEHLMAVARARGFEAVYADPAMLPQDAASLLDYDAVILANVPADRLTAGQMRLLEVGVRDLGIGLVMIGGPQSFGAGDYLGTPVEDVLPVTMDVPQHKVKPQGALILAVDCSGSMEGDKIQQAKPAARAAIEALSPQDYVGVLAFNATSEWVARPVLTRNRGQLFDAVNRLSAGGGTDIMHALTAAHEALRPIDAAVKHIVLLSDGQSDSAGIEARLAAINGDQITVTTIGIGERHGQPLMQAIAQRTGGRFHYVADPRQLPQIFIAEAKVVRRGYVFEEPFVPQGAMASELSAGLRETGLPPLQAYVVTTPRETAVVPLVSANENRDPVLAHWRCGLGKTIAFTSDASSNWGREWVGWSGYAPFWERLLRWVVRQRHAADFSVRTEFNGNTGKVVIDAMDKDGEYLNFIDFQGRLVNPGHESRELSVRQTGPGRYEADFTARTAGVNLLNLAYLDPRTDEQGALSAGVAVQPSAEYRRYSTNLPLLRRAAAIGGGRLLPPDPTAADIFTADLPPERSLTSIWDWLLIAAILLFLADVTLRRVVVSREDLAGLLRRWRPEPRDPTAAAVTVSTLLDHKREVREEGPTPPTVAAPPHLAAPPKIAAPSLPPTRPDSPAAKDTEATEAPEKADSRPPASPFTARLLEAKRRAKKRR